MKTILKSKKRALLSGVLAIMLLAAAGTTIALLMHNTDSVTNKFQPTEVTCHVDEEFDGETKTDVRIQNTGDVGAYIRATVVLNWVDPDNLKVIAPVAVTWDDVNCIKGSEWIEGADGYFYYPNVVPAGNDKYTGNLIDSIKVAERTLPPEGYVLSVEIIADAIQADGGSYVTVDGEKVWQPAVQQAWSNDKVNVTVENGKLVVKPVSGQ